MKSSPNKRPAQSLQRLGLVIAATALLSLACAINPFGRNKPQAVSNTTSTPRATFTAPATELPSPVPRDTAPTPSPTLLPPVPREGTGTATATPIATAKPANQPTATPTPFPTPVSLNTDWQILNTHAVQLEGEFLVTGELVNEALAPQQNVVVSGAFYNADGKAIPVENTIDFVPLAIIPVDIPVPFQLSVQTSQQVARYDLQVTAAEATSDGPRDDFDISEVETWVDDNGEFCLRGVVENQGAPIQNSLLVLATLYNPPGEMVGFAQFPVSRPDTLQGGAGTSFELCVPYDEGVIDRYEVVALGQ